MLRRMWLLAAVLVLGLSATAVASAAPAVKKGGTLLFGAEQEPPCLNPQFNDCNNIWTNYVDLLVFRGAFMTQPDYSYKLDLMSSVKLRLNPMRLTYTIRKNAVWSDGKPVTAQDMVWTWHTIMDTSLDSKPQGSGIVSRDGLDRISKATVQGQKTVTFTFREPYADWKDLFGYVYPSHALAGKDFSTQWFGGPTLSDGPFKFVKWEKGSQIVLTRNPTYYGHKANLSGISFRFLTDSNTEIQQIKGGEIDAIYPSPQLALADLRKTPGVRVQSNVGPQYEHIDIQQGAKGNPLAKNAWVRQALMLSIDRQQLVKVLYGKLNPNLKPLDSVIYLNNMQPYVPHFARWNYNPKKAASLLAAHGCKKGGDGIYVCGGKRLSFALESTAGNQLRELAFTIVQQQLRANGIEVTNNLKPSNVAFGQDLTAGNYDLFMFAWQGGADPAGGTTIWACNAGQNFMGYCNPQATRLLHQADVTLDPAKRIALENRADALIANDVPTIPLFQKPSFLVYRSNVEGMRDNTSQPGPFYAAENWSLGK